MVFWRLSGCLGTGGRRGGLILDAVTGELTMDDKAEIDAEDIAEVMDACST